MAQQSWLGQTLGSRYIIEEPLGRGGMSSVFKGRDPNLRRTVAIKLIHAHLADDPEFVRRFEEEAAAVAQLRHPHIIQVFDFNHDDDTYYMILEYLDGETLETRLHELKRAGRALSTADIIAIMGDLCAAAGYAHSQGMIHRDLKPANVMIRPNGDATLMDFGIAKMLESDHHTATGALVGTVAYMSPEQIQGKRPDHRTDIYALGVMLYEMATGERPFKGDNSASTMMMHLTEPVPNLSEVNRDVPIALANIVSKAMAKDPAQRYQSAAALASALQAAANAASLPGDNLINADDDQTVLATPLADTIIDRDHTAVTPERPTAVRAAPQPSAPPTQVAGGRSAPRWGLIGGIVALVALAIVAGFFLLGGSDPNADADGDGLTNAEEAELGTNPEAADTDGDGLSDSNENAVPCLDGLRADTDGDGLMDNEDDDPCGAQAPPKSVAITNITLEGGLYRVDFETTNYTPTAGSEHVHFYFNTVPEDQAGVPGDGPWDIHVQGSPYQGMGPLDKPAEATQICAIVGNPDHSVKLGTGQCFDLPEDTAAPSQTVQITGITLADEAYRVEFVTNGYTPSPSAEHIHFFFDSVPPEEAGVPGDGPWNIHVNADPYAAWGPADRPEDATQMCALVANKDHTVRQATGNCFPLPDVESPDPYGYND